MIVSLTPALLQPHQAIGAGVEPRLGRVDGLDYGRLTQTALHHLDDIVVGHGRGIGCQRKQRNEQQQRADEIFHGFKASFNTQMLIYP